MGNRTYLTMNDVQLFEGNNALPVFWLLGFNGSFLETFERDINQLEELLVTNYEETEAYEKFLETYLIKTGLGSIQIETETYVRNLERHQSYIAAAYPSLVSLFQQFQGIIQTENTYADKTKITLHYQEYLGFYELFADFTGELKDLFEQVRTFEKTKWIYEGALIASTVGFDDYSNHHSEKISAQKKELAEIQRAFLKETLQEDEPESSSESLIMRCLNFFKRK